MWIANVSLHFILFKNFIKEAIDYFSELRVLRPSDGHYLSSGGELGSLGFRHGGLVFFRVYCDRVICFQSPLANNKVTAIDRL